jgi:hypothetical protein
MGKFANQKNVIMKTAVEQFLDAIKDQIPLSNEHLEMIESYASQAERMYSEEEVLQLLLRLQQTESYDNLYDWFEQNKKK